MADTTGLYDHRFNASAIDYVSSKHESPAIRSSCLQRNRPREYSHQRPDALIQYIREYVGPLVAKKGFNAVFFDGADEWMMQSRHTWKVATNVPKNATDQVKRPQPSPSLELELHLSPRCAVAKAPDATRHDMSRSEVHNELP